MERRIRSRSRLSALVGLILTFALVLTGCSGLFNDQGGSGSGDGKGGKNSAITVQMTNFAHLDPQSIGWGMWFDQMGLLEGLVLQNPEGTDVRPGAAKSWKVSDDQLHYTFTLRDGLQWSNGDPVTAEDFAWTYQRLMDPKRGSGGVTTDASSFQATIGIKNAADYNLGTVKDFSDVGIEAVDDKTLEFTLGGPNPGFLMALTHPSMLPLNPKAVKNEGKDWQQPANWVGDGPYNVSAWTPNSSITLKKNPKYWNAANVKINTINVQLIEPGSVTNTVEFENGSVDIQPLSNAGDITRFSKDDKLSKDLRRQDRLGTTYLARLASKNTTLDDPKVMQALRLGVGRQQIAGVSDTSEPATTLMSRNVPGWDKSIARDQQMWGPQAVKRARQLLADAGYPNGKGFPKLTILAGADSPELDATVDTLSKNLNIKIKKDVVESGVYVQKRAELHDSDYVGFWWGSYSGMFTWSYQVEAMWSVQQVQTLSLTGKEYAEYLALQDKPLKDSGKQNGRLQDYLTKHASPDAVEFADLLAQAKKATGDQQVELFRKAAAAKERTDGLMPLYWSSGVTAVQPRIKGLSLRAQAEHYYFRDLSVDNA